MIIAIPTDRNEGLDSTVYPHFGSAPFFILYNTETRSTDTVDNANAEHEHGSCNPVKALAGSRVDSVITGGMGKRALAGLLEIGIEAYLAPENSTAHAIITMLKEEKLQQLTLENACGGHQHGCG